MSTSTLIALVVVAWLVLVLALRLIGQRLARGPRGDAITGLLWLGFRAYCRLMHRVRIEGREHVPDSNSPGGLIVVTNHTGPVDPLLIQAGCRFEIRWMMARDMMVPKLAWLWKRQRIIPVGRDGKDLAAAREAIRHVRGGGVIGIFPEGGIVRPAGEIRFFHEGVGLIIAKTEAPVLLVWVRDTPEPKAMMPALRSPSRSRVTFVDRLDFEGKRDPGAVTETLRQRLAEASGWRLSDEPVIPPRMATTADPFAA
jgi:1-acyl-sn-glycerol-3-phosphate acyltransferase